MGDFYETFDEDAELVARELDIVLTSRNVAKGNRVPMAGVPHHAAENYLARLIEKGHHVAICEQIDSEPQNGLMPRAVVRVVTPGTVVEPGLLPSDANNYLAAVLILVASFFVPGGSTGAGWTLYPPQAISPGTPGIDNDGACRLNIDRADGQFCLCNFHFSVELLCSS